MNVKELAEWLLAFHDQEAVVNIVYHHRSGTGYYDQGGNACEETFDPNKHVEYTDFKDNPFVQETAEYYNKSYVLLGSIDV